MDTIDFSTRDRDLTKKIKGISLEAKPEDCYTCLKCTNGCPANKIFSDFVPHKFQIAAHLGLVDDILESGVLWNCFNCLTCKTRCPMLTSPVQTISALTNISVNRGMNPPKVFVEVIKNIANIGAISKPREAQTTDFDFVDRDDLGLPVRGIANLEKFQEALKVIGAYDIIEMQQEEK